MKSAILCLSLLSLVACGKKGSNDKNPSPVAPPTENTGTPTDPTPGTTPGNGSGNAEGNGTTPGTGSGPGTEPGNPAAGSPLVGLYLAACEVEGTEGIASGIEITSTHIFPATALFSSPDCSKDSLIAWGHTGDYRDFESYAAHVAAKTKALGDETVASYEEGAIKLVSSAGITNRLVRTRVMLSPEKRLKIFVSKHTVDVRGGLVSGEAILSKGPLAVGEFDIGLYCEDANKKNVRQKVTFTNEPSGLITFSGVLNVWAPVPAITRCQVTLAVLQKNTATPQSHDVAWSQYIDVK